MSPWIALSLYTWLQLALGQNLPEADSPPFVPDCEGDVLFLTDSSGSVSYKEFSQVKAFVADLLQPFTFGPQDVQTSVIHISTVPAVEFPFDQHASSESVQRAIRNMKQRMGDTNTGQALYLAKEKIFTDEAGARPNVPKVLVWVTDGISTDDISQPMKLLKDMGVTVFIVSTGRGNYLELSQAASQPTEKHLHFVDVDDLHIITKELRDDIIEVIRAQRLKALDVTPRSFRLTWPRLLSISTGYYVVEYAPTAAPHRKLRLNVAGDQTEVLVRGLTPGTSYNVTLIPESNEQFIRHQNIKVTTLKEVIWGEKLKAQDITTTSFRLTWPKLLSIDTGYYVVEYTTMAEPQKKMKVKVAGDQTEVVLKDLAPGTSYNVTLILDSNQLYARPQTIQVSTLKEVVWTEDLKVLDVTPTSFRLTWPILLSINTGNYVVEYAPVSEPHRKVRMNVPGDQSGVVVKNLAPGTRYKVTVTPESRDQYIQPQTVQVTTLKEVIWREDLKVLDVTPTSFRLTWPILLSINTGYYVVEYAPVSEPHRTVRMNVPGDQTGVVVKDLTSGTRYKVTVTPESRDQYIQPQTVQVTTLKEVIWTGNLKVLDVTPSSFRLTWPQLLSINTGYYLVEYAPVSDPHQKVILNVTGDQTGLVVRNLAPGISYTVTVKPESNQFIQPQTVQVTTLREVIWMENLKVLDITPSSFRLTWPRLLSINTGYYVVEYAPISEPHRKVRMNVPGDQTGVVVKDLAPGISYTVTVIPESREQHIQPQTVQVTTLKEVIWTENLKVLDITPSSFRLTWPQLLSINTGYYLVIYASVSDPHRKVILNVTGDQTGLVVRNLQPGISYTVTVKPESNQFIQPQTVQVTTLREVIWMENLKVLDITPSSFRLTWPRLLSINTGFYVVEYAPISEPHRKVRMNVPGDQTGVVVKDLAPGISYTVTVIPKSREQHIQPQTVKITTLKEVISTEDLKVMDVTPWSFRLAWPQLLSIYTGYYLVEYAPISEPDRKLIVNVAGDQTGVEVQYLAPGTSYKVTVTPKSNEQYIEPQTVQVTTLKEGIWTENLKVLDVTPSSFRLTWPILLSINTGNYVVEYAPVSEPHRKVRMNVPGDQTGVVVKDLAPGTRYKVTVTPESTDKYIQPQTVQVTTLKAVIWTENLKVLDVTPSSFRLTWPHLLTINTGYYLVEYAPVSEPHQKVILNVTGDQTGLLVRNLQPGISYTVTVKPESNQFIQPQTVQVTTLREVIWTENLKVLDITPSSFRLTWPRLLSINTGYYVVEYAPVSEPHRTVRMNVPGDQTGVVVKDLAPGVGYTVTVIPESRELYIQPQTVKVTTLKEVIWTENLKALDVTPWSFRLTWPRLLSIYTGYYLVEYAPISEPDRKLIVNVPGDQTGVEVQYLAPGTIYKVTVTPKSNEQYIEPQTVQVTTLKEVIWTERLKVFDVTSSSFRLTWPGLIPQNAGYYVVEYTPVAQPERKLRMLVSGDQTSVVVRNLTPGTRYNVTVIPESNEQYIHPQAVQVTTLEDRISPAQILISRSNSSSFQVSWSPTPESVASYQILYGPLPGNSVKLLEVDGSRNSTTVDNLAPNTTYLVTVTALYKSGQEKALSAKACTEEENSRVRHLHLEDMGNNMLKVTWDSADGEVVGYRVRCRRQAGTSSLISVAPETHSVLLPGLTDGGTNKICVKPVYRNKPGKSRCKKGRIQPATLAPSYPMIRSS
ncbi:von Willebrand factor A domain-containing protein 1 isoform X1 [Pleurodeles waltl]|uniref:von Willebrand factor A domain-containing protein 1 isoform X1 n=1 Tax=Pleurodeles waltl TaxID=8319 RepID=UPI00370972D2